MDFHDCEHCKLNNKKYQYHPEDCPAFDLETEYSYDFDDGEDMPATARYIDRQYCGNKEEI